MKLEVSTGGEEMLHSNAVWAVTLIASVGLMASREAGPFASLRSSGPGHEHDVYAVIGTCFKTASPSHP
jgi:hypothetical protein